jgi:uncharacterized repeat protein (TIGR02543 family)
VGRALDVKLMYNYAGAANNGLYRTIIVPITGENNEGDAATLQEGIAEASAGIGRANYEFEGWYESRSGGVQFNPANPLLTATEIYAHWKPVEHTFKFDYNYPAGETQTQPAIVEIQGNCETQLARPETPALQHYTFAGWHTDTAGRIPYTPPETVEETRTIYAHWTGKQYSVIFDAGDNASPKTQTVTVTYPAKAEEPLYTPVKANYGFNGWFTNTEGGEAFTIPYVPVEDGKKFYAHWAAGQAILVLNYNGNGDAPKLIKPPYDETLSLTDEDKPSRANYAFAGWYDDPTGGELYGDADGVVSIDHYKGEPAVLYARWTAKEFTLTLKNDSTTSMIESVYPGDITLPNPVKEGYEFKGWYDSSNAKAGDVLNAYAGTPSQLTAKWEIKTYTVNFFKNDGLGGIVQAPKTVNHGVSVELPIITNTRAGHVAKGWYSKSSGGEKLTSNPTITANTNFYIQWIYYTDASIPPDASGGETKYVSTTAGFDEVHIFRADGAFTMASGYSPAGKVLIVAGGGGGGAGSDNDAGGGGGAGGVLYGGAISLSGGSSKSVTVGAGGNGGGGSNAGKGGSSAFDGATAYGGGRGGRGNDNNTTGGYPNGSGDAGGSGGGAGAGPGENTYSGGSATKGSGSSYSAYGNAGGGSSSGTSGGGGGGAGTAGTAGFGNYGERDGGDGKNFSDIDTVLYAPGGKSGLTNNSTEGSKASIPGGGGQGGGAGNSGGGAQGGDGASGIVIVRFPYKYISN